MVTGGLSTTEPSPVGTAGSGGLAPGAIAGLIIGILLSLVLGVAVLMAVLCLVKRRQARQNYSTGKATDDNGLGRS